MITIDYIITGVIAIFLTVLGFFLKRTIGEVDDLKDDMQDVRLNYTPRKDFRELETKIDTVTEKVNEVQRDSISKDDFFIQMAKVERMLERMDEKMERYRDGK